MYRGRHVLRRETGSEIGSKSGRQSTEGPFSHPSNRLSHGLREAVGAGWAAARITLERGRHDRPLPPM